MNNNSIKIPKKWNEKTRNTKSESFKTIEKWIKLFEKKGWEKIELERYGDNEGALYEDCALKKNGIVIRICKGDEFPKESPEEEDYGESTFVSLTVEFNGFKTRKYFLGKGEEGGGKEEIHLDSKKKNLIGSYFTTWYDRWGCENLHEEEEFTLAL